MKMNLKLASGLHSPDVIAPRIMRIEHRKNVTVKLAHIPLRIVLNSAGIWDVLGSGGGLIT
jgi:hypothetical protein